MADWPIPHSCVVAGRPVRRPLLPNSISERIVAKAGFAPLFVSACTSFSDVHEIELTNPLRGFSIPARSRLSTGTLCASSMIVWSKDVSLSTK